LRREYRVDPEQLSDSEWAKLVEEYRFCKRLDDERLQHNFKEALYEVAAAIFGKSES